VPFVIFIVMLQVRQVGRSMID